ncbi:Predicted Peptidoglycan domain-containing protein [Hymenobacter gelipurpurascens]|uniref:Predicted Peptidoglycan domain-containing protein n=2 Tax=Hymenobacter gelipurpurascens TaxID=89968 RepID=A0A212T7Z1_9BACT|nr:Predicted Peptidoglycan domain-containing protein [Hymenobacter gelipurpurascens]
MFHQHPKLTKMANFETAYHKTAAVEGGYADNPKDRGGETWKGVARNFNPQWLGWALVDYHRKAPGFPGTLATDAKLQEHVLRFYKLGYWDANRLGELNDQDIANELYDTAVNCGVGVASRFLQRALNLTNRNGVDYPDLVVDGKIGPITIARMNNHRRPKLILKILNTMQGGKYIDIAEGRHDQEEFINSWFSRVSLAA